MGRQGAKSAYSYAAFLILAAVVLASLLIGGGGPGGTGGGDASVAAAPEGPSPSDTAPGLHAAGPFPGFPINLNTATIDELVTLPGIGRKTAERILALRAERGAFLRVEELLDVRWVGRSTLDGLRPLVTVGPPGEPPGSGT